MLELFQKDLFRFVILSSILLVYKSAKVEKEFANQLPLSLQSDVP